MATGKKSFILYCDQRGTWERLSDEQAGKLIKHVLAYVNDENPEADFITELAFEGIKRALKADLIKYDEIKAKRSEAGRKGGKQTQAKQANATFAQANQAVNVNVNGNVTVNDNEKETLTEFDIFWLGYNKNVGLVPCQREWANIDEPEYAKIIRHVPKYVAATPDVKYRLNPINYLKNRTWLDADLPKQKETAKPQETKEEWSRRQTARIRS